MIKKGDLFLFLVFLMLVIPLTSAGFFSDFWGKITGEATDVQTVDLNISVTTGTVPWIYNITGLGAITLTDGPSPTYLTINFSVNDSDGADNLDNSSAALNLTKAGEPIKLNSTCAVKDFGGNHANYSCNITMWWWDGSGAWTVYANISDLNENTHVNGTHTRSVGVLTGLTMSPSSLSFSGSLLAAATNQTPTNHLTLNNTGNSDISATNIQVNATDLFGETTPGHILWAGNFSFNDLTGGDTECNVSGTTDATAMVNVTYTGIYGATLTADNFTHNNGTGQETLYLCLREVGSELSQQQYSTSAVGSWTVKIIP